MISTILIPLLLFLNYKIAHKDKNFDHFFLILSQSLSHSLAHSSSSNHHSMEGEWIADKGMRWLQRHSWFSMLITHHNSFCLWKTQSILLATNSLLATQETSFLVWAFLILSTTKPQENQASNNWDRGREFNSTPPVPCWYFNHYTGYKWESEVQGQWPLGSSSTGIQASSRSWRHAPGLQRFPPFPEGCWL